MIIFPAIDIRGGRCVRLTEGRFDQETVFADDPSEMAARWSAAGAVSMLKTGKPLSKAGVSAVVSML